MALTYAELFAGAGGMSLGLEAGGFHAAAHAEIEPHARAVLRHRWPNTRLDGDVTQINGADYTGITLLSGGSPCQDLSVAGKRAGLTGSRSSLFHQQVRIWHESGAPYLLWENVAGALSSNKGRDFATVLSTIVGSTVTVPADGWRGGGGVVAGRDAVAAFRVLDLQHFGPPQRRVRVFVLAARAGGIDPAEVLSLAEGVCGHPSPRQQSREIAASGTRGSVEGGVAFHLKQTPISGDVAPAIGRTTDGMGVMEIVVGNSGMESWKTVDVAIGLAARDAKGTNHDVIGTLDFGGHGGSYNGQDAYSGRILPSGGRPRRLTPLECERLMSWPDQWTATGRKDDGTEYQLSDTARYRLCGNGVGSVCAEWIARRLHDAIQRQEEA
jgi:DNA (cytosine-5)-methyltransferase 1